MKNLKYLFLLTFAICTISYAAQHPPATNATQFTNSAEIITVSVNSPTFLIRLKSNPTTGYSWFAKKYDMQLIDIEGHKYFAPNTKLIGASGYEEWLFKVKSPSRLKTPVTTSIGMSYERPWEKAPTKMVMFKVIIK
jgi:inhibitor of cysteine peptidase